MTDDENIEFLRRLIRQTYGNDWILTDRAINGIRFKINDYTNFLTLTENQLMVHKYGYRDVADSLDISNPESDPVA